VPVRCYTPWQFAAIPHVSSLLYPVAVRCYTPWCEGIALSRSLAERGQPAQLCYLATSPHADGAAGQSSGSARQTIPPYLPASPFTGVDGRLRKGGDRQQCTTLPAGSDPSLSSAAPSWARVVRDGESATSQPPQSSFSPREDFFRLYELCIANVFTACSQSVAPQAPRRFCSPARSEPHHLTPPLQSSNAAISGTAAFGIRPWVTRRTT
jgi:hypothetical protein